MAFHSVRKKPLDIRRAQDQAFVGHYMETREYTGELGKKKIHKFRDEKGKEFEIYGFTTLDRDMENVEIGTKTMITYLGKQKSKKSGREFHAVEVQIDTEDKEVA